MTSCNSTKTTLLRSICKQRSQLCLLLQYLWSWPPMKQHSCPDKTVPDKRVQNLCQNTLFGNNYVVISLIFVQRNTIIWITKGVSLLMDVYMFYSISSSDYCLGLFCLFSWDYFVWDCFVGEYFAIWDCFVRDCFVWDCFVWDCLSVHQQHYIFLHVEPDYGQLSVSAWEFYEPP